MNTTLEMEKPISLPAVESAKHIVQLDGLRGVAVFMVLLLHHQLLDIGWMGVDLFFVLSGLLITRILRKESNKPNYWRNFYIKRATRILPPFLLLIGIVALCVSQTSLVGLLGYTFSL